jgi:ABC-2 type transport system permease protein
LKELLHAEWLKIRTTRTVLWYLTILVVVIGVAIAGQIVNAPREVLEGEQGFMDVLQASSFATFFTLLYGLIGMAGEYRHGTITPTFLATPVRHRVLTAKLLSYAAVGLLLGVVAVLVTLAMALPWLAAKNVDVHFDNREFALAVLGVLAAAALWGALGVALGSVVPNQVGAIVVALVWLLILDNLVSALVPAVAPFTPGGAVRGLMRIDGDDVLTMWAAAAVTTAYFTVLAGIGAAFVIRRDVT